MISNQFHYALILQYVSEQLAYELPEPTFIGGRLSDKVCSVAYLLEGIVEVECSIDMLEDLELDEGLKQAALEAFSQDGQETRILDLETVGLFGIEWFLESERLRLDIDDPVSDRHLRDIEASEFVALFELYIDLGFSVAHEGPVLDIINPEQTAIKAANVLSSVR